MVPNDIFVQIRLVNADGIFQELLQLFTDPQEHMWDVKMSRMVILNPSTHRPNSVEYIKELIDCARVILTGNFEFEAVYYNEGKVERILHTKVGDIEETQYLLPFYDPVQSYLNL